MSMFSKAGDSNSQILGDIIGLRLGHFIFAISIGISVGIGVFGVLEFLLHPPGANSHGDSYWIHYATHIGIGALASIVVVLFVLSIAQRFHARGQQHLRDAYSFLNTAFENKKQELTRSQALLECLFDTMQERILVINRQGRIVLANRSAREQTGRELEGHLMCEVFSTSSKSVDERRQESNFVKYCFENYPGKDCPCKGRLIRGGPDGRQLFSVDVYPVAGTTGDTDLVIEVARDVTYEKELEFQQQHQEKMAALGLLAAGVAHDLANPLASLQSELELFKLRQDADDAGPIDVIEKHLHRINEMLKEVVDFARRRSELSTSSHVPQAVADAWRLVEHDRRAHKTKVVNDFESDLPAVEIAEDNLVFIIINLLLNAFDAMPHGGKVWITAKLEGKNGVLLTLRDSGVGMSEEVLKHATDPMFTTKKAPLGTGLGLSVSADLMRAVGGEMELSSCPGEGTTVGLHFRLRKDAEIASTDFGKEAVSDA